MKNYLELLSIDHYKRLTGLRELSKLAATEGIVLLKNEGVLPLSGKINVFGRIQTDYYKSGTGSGGLVNVKAVTSIVEALLENPLVTVNETLLQTYQNWQINNPFNAGLGRWATEPWSQTEMVLTDDILTEAKSFSDQAIIIIGRTAGEDKDNQLEKGSYYLSDEESLMIKQVSSTFKKTIVILNVGNPIDMSFMDENTISACLYVWHGGEDGARAVSDVITGIYSPSGKLPMTISKSIIDHYAHRNFGNQTENYYQEDVYVGYRYFETFKPQAVRYPFGYGLSYSKFEYQCQFKHNDPYQIEVDVKNIGSMRAKEVVQVYIESPITLLGRPSKVLVGYLKTPMLEVGESRTLYFEFTKYDFASYDEIGITGFKSSYVLEKGLYKIHVATSIRDIVESTDLVINETELIKKSEEALRPVKSFKRLKPTYEGDLILETLEETPLRTYDLANRMKEREPIAHENTCLEKRTLLDVYNKRVSVEAFVSQLDDQSLIELTRAEGMSSPKVTPGTASAFGGVTDTLKTYGFPIACCADGPSGIRMDSGFLATSLPNGTLLASSFNNHLVESLYYALGLELIAYEVDNLLGPGLNIQRHPLCGRNFEYFSEDPYLSGHMSKSALLGLKGAGVSGTLKHLAANNQESYRTQVDSIVSERALREIYLRGFEIAIKEGKADSIMTAYNPVNGIWSASNYDLNTTIIRNEFGFRGIIMTDWWAKMNDEGEEATLHNTKAMVKAQNDLYMVVEDSKNNSNKDNLEESLKQNLISRGELQKVAKNISHYIMDTEAFRRLNHLQFKPRIPHLYLPFLNSVKINGTPLDSFDPRVCEYVLNVKNYFNVEVTVEKGFTYEIKKGPRSVIVKVFNHREQNTYLFTNIERLIQSDETFFGEFDSNKPFKIGESLLSKTQLDFSMNSYQTEDLIVSDGVHFNKNGIISFSLNVLSYGKYIFEIELLSDDSKLAQIPFSILIDKISKSTITTHGTEGKLEWINPEIILEEGKQLCSFKAHRSGLVIKQIIIKKHP